VRQDDPVSFTVRRLTADDDAEAAWQLAFEAFGVPSPRPGPATLDLPGRTWFGAFADDVLVGQMIDRAYDSYFGGALVPTCGIAAVTVATEYRGQGSLSPLFTETLRFARERGAVISTLFPTAPGVYRRFGYELIADFVTVELRTAMLAAVPRPTGVRTRRATAADFDAIRAVYDAWAIEQNGPLSRRGVSFPATAEDFLGSFTGVTVALDPADRVCGFASWNRGEGYGEQAVMRVADLLASTADGYRALLAAVGSFASVTGITKIDTSGDDLSRLFLPSLPWQVAGSSPYMLKILDLPGAIGLRRYAPGLTAQLPFRVEGDFLEANDGGYVLTVSGGRAECVRDVHVDDRTLTTRGLALLYAGVQSCANLRAAGLLSGGDVQQDLDWDAAFGGRRAHIRDYF
jgi:predicted acetyltransferase